jgi:hypothetical protein
MWKAFWLVAQTYKHMPGNMILTKMILQYIQIGTAWFLLFNSWVEASAGGL